MFPLPTSCIYIHTTKSCTLHLPAGTYKTTIIQISVSHADTKETVAEHLTGKHNAQFDHEAFLGKSESDKFDKLTPQEAKLRLG